VDQTDKCIVARVTVKPANIGLFSAWRRAQNRTAWSGLIRTPMPQCGVRPWSWWLRLSF